MTVKELIDLFDNWNIPIVINDNNLNRIVKDQHIFNFLEERKPLLKEKVVSFGFYDGELCIRIDYILKSKRIKSNA